MLPRRLFLLRRALPGAALLALALAALLVPAAHAQTASQRTDARAQQAAERLAALLPARLPGYRLADTSTIAGGESGLIEAYGGYHPTDAQRARWPEGYDVSASVSLIDLGDVIEDARRQMRSCVEEGTREQASEDGRTVFYGSDEVTERSTEQRARVQVIAGRVLAQITLHATVQDVDPDQQRAMIDTLNLKPQLRKLLDAVDPQALRQYTTEAPTPDVIYASVFCPRQPDAFADPKALAAFLPDTLAGRERLAMKDRFFHRGASITKLYEDSLVVSLQDRGGLLYRVNKLLHHEADESRLRAFSIGDVPAFQHTGQALQIDIRTRDWLIQPLGAVALVGGRFIAQAAVYSKVVHTAEDVAALPPEKVKARMDAARAALEALDLKGLSALAAKYDTDFAERFAACQAPAATTVGSRDVVYHYELLGPRDGGCAVRSHFVKNPNPDWVGPAMTCVFDNTRPFGEAVKDMSRCNGPLAERMSP